MNPVSAIEPGSHSAADVVRALLRADPPVAEPSPGANAGGTGLSPGANGTPLSQGPHAAHAAQSPNPADAATAVRAAELPPATEPSATLSRLAADDTASRALDSAARAGAPPAADPQRQATGPVPDAVQAAPQPLPEAAGAAAARPADLLAVPVLATPMFTPAPDALRPQALPRDDEPLRRHPRAPGGEEADEHESSERDDEAAAASDDETPLLDARAEAGETAANGANPSAGARAADYQRMLRGLAQAGQHEALRELELGRRVLLVQPHADAAGGLVSAQALLLAPARPSAATAAVTPAAHAPHAANAAAAAARAAGSVHRFGARWWPGARTGEKAEAAWPGWRVHREGGSGLRTRAENHPRGGLQVRVGAARPGLLDADSASLDIADPQRFARALGRQWSLLVLAQPPRPHPGPPAGKGREREAA